MSNQNKSCLDLVPIFASLTEEEKKEVAYISSTNKYEKGQTIYNQGSQSKDLYIIHKGKVKISRLTKDGKEQVLRTLNPGSFMGELSLFLEDTHNDSATVLENTQICFLDGERFKELLVEMPSIALKLLKEISKRLNETEDTVESIGVLDVETRLIKKILELAEDKNSLKLPYSKRDFASLLGMSSETLSRKLTHLQDLKLIDLEGQRIIYIKNRKALEALMM